MKLAAVVNRESGYVSEHSPAHVRVMLENGIHNREGPVAMVSPDEVLDALKEAFNGPADAVVVLGGDGTARCAAELARETGKPLAPLPGGTMNLLPHKVYGALGPADALSAAVNGRVIQLDAGEADGHLFFLSAAFGVAPNLARAREAFRGANPTNALPNALEFMKEAAAGIFEPCVWFGIDTAEEDEAAEALILALGGVDHLMDAGLNDDFDHRFEIIASSVHNLGDVARLGFNAMMQRWRDDPGVDVRHAHCLRVRLKKEDPYGVLDGEPVELSHEFVVNYLENAIPVLAPSS